MNEPSGQKMVTITIDGHPVVAEHRAPLIEVTRRLGISIPTLCHHEALEPAGACRVCTVERVRDGWSQFVTACNFPVEEGMVFRTASEPVLKWRRLTLEALLARCPGVPVIREMAAKAGVTVPRFPANDDTCILCGLCTRVCSTYATSAIAALSRGGTKEIGGFGKAPPEDCVGCGGCEAVCPTGHIKVTQREGVYRIWETEHRLPICEVDREKCVACGACEEACPFAIPRVVVRRHGRGAAFIDAETCRGCGVCLAACPTGAIRQPGADGTLPARGKGVLAIGCPRSGLGRRGFPAVPEGVTTLELPCTGAVNAALLLGALARGFDGVLVMGRHQETCRLDGAEKHARDVVRRVEALARLAGLGAGRVRFVDPPGGPAGPTRAIEEFRAALPGTALREMYPAARPAARLEDAVAILEWLGARRELSPTPDARIVGGAFPKNVELLEALFGEWVDGAELAAGDRIEKVFDALDARRGAWRRTRVQVTR